MGLLVPVWLASRRIQNSCTGKLRRGGPVCHFTTGFMFIGSFVAPGIAAAAFALISTGGDEAASGVNTATNVTVGTPIQTPVGPFGVAVNPAGTRVYVTNTAGVSVIHTATNTVTGSISLP